jgi:hypothetical protein
VAIILGNIFYCKEYNSMFTIYPTVQNGDCLFDSLRIMMASIGLHYSLPYLRSVVAQSILNLHRDKNVYHTVHGWYELFHSFVNSHEQSMLQEYQFMQPTYRQPWPLSVHVLQDLVKSMMVPKLYWGEEFALRTFEKQLQIRFFILEKVKGKGYRLHAPLCHNDDVAYQPTHYLWLHLANRHYQPLSFQGQFVFAPSELPVYLQKMIQKAHVSSGWVHFET